MKLVRPDVISTFWQERMRELHHLSWIKGMFPFLAILNKINQNAKGQIVLWILVCIGFVFMIPSLPWLITCALDQESHTLSVIVHAGNILCRTIHFNHKWLLSLLLNLLNYYTGRNPISLLARKTLQFRFWSVGILLCNNWISHYAMYQLFFPKCTPSIFTF